MTVSFDFLRRRRIGAAALIVAGVGLSGCAGMSDNMSTAFADPAKYELYDCAQLATERTRLANRTAELQGLMSKAETGVAGPLVAEVAYRNEYMATRGQATFAEEAWRRNKCQDAAPAPPTRPVRPDFNARPPRSGARPN